MMVMRRRHAVSMALPQPGLPCPFVLCFHGGGQTVRLCCVFMVAATQHPLGFLHIVF
jgi:hypothetical protein